MTISGSDHIYPLYRRETPEKWIVTDGLTKREHFASMAMQGLVAHYGYEEAPVTSSEEMAQWSVKLADALIHELNEQVTLDTRQHNSSLKPLAHHT